MAGFIAHFLRVIGMFTGSHTVKLDSSGRLVLPAAYRESFVEHCGEGVVLTLSAKLFCAVLIPDRLWPNLEAEFRASEPDERQKHRRYGNLTKIPMDPAKRMLVPLPATLRSLIGVASGKPVTVVGIGSDYLEIWSEERFQAYINSGIEGGAPPGQGAG